MVRKSENDKYDDSPAETDLYMTQPKIVSLSFFPLLVVNDAVLPNNSIKDKRCDMTE